MATVYEIVQGLSQAAANAYDGALTEDGDALKAGLQREEGDPILDKRIIDGFGVKFYGNMMCLTYESDVLLREVYGTGFEDEIRQRVADISSFLKKEYKKITGRSVSLTEEGDIDVFVQSSSNMRTWVQAKMHYKIGGLSEEMSINNTGDRPEEQWKSFVELGGWVKRPPNDKRKKE